jgi:quercetin dioxygenase-like cupin family protein
MKITRPDRSAGGPPDRPEYFSGTVRMQHLHRTDDPRGIEILAVFFDAGSRTRPHVHHTDQTLVFFEGEGIVATETERWTVRAGEIALIPAGTWHWHGATREAAASHLSIKPAGPTEWDAPLRDWDEY